MISLNIIVKDQAEEFRECLEHIHKYVDQVVIVIDNNSNDIEELMKISHSYHISDRIMILDEWHNSFAEHRNLALDNSSYDWILSLDADERLSQEAIDMLPYYTNQNRYWAIAFRRKNLVSKIDPDYQVRLFRRDKGRWRHRVYEVLTGIPFSKILFSEAKIIHKEIAFKSKPEEYERRKQLLDLDEKETNMKLAWLTVKQARDSFIFPAWITNEEYKKYKKSNKLVDRSK